MIGTAVAMILLFVCMEMMLTSIMKIYIIVIDEFVFFFEIENSQFRDQSLFRDW